MGEQRASDKFVIGGQREFKGQVMATVERKKKTKQPTTTHN